MQDFDDKPTASLWIYQGTSFGYNRPPNAYDALLQHTTCTLCSVRTIWHNALASAERVFYAPSRGDCSSLRSSRPAATAASCLRPSRAWGAAQQLASSSARARRRDFWV